MSILALLVGLVVFCLVFWTATRIMRAFGVGEPITTVIYVVLVVCFCLWLLSAFGVIGAPNMRLT